jgi:ATP-dependent DNA ligase
VGSILLGLYTPDGELHMVGGAASFSVKDRIKLLADLEPLRDGDARDGDASRWNSAADKRWIPVRPERVAEVAYDQMEGNVGASEATGGNVGASEATGGNVGASEATGGNSAHGVRFRHAVKFVRWRPDRDPQSCSFAQLDTPLNYDLFDVLES